MDIVCVDTNVLILGMHDKTERKQQDGVFQAKTFLKDCSEKKIRVIVPSIVVAEFLIGVPEDKQDALTALISTKFVVAPLDTRISVQVARLWKRNKGIVVASRNELKVDCIIVATAVSYRVSCIYSDDEHIPKIAKEQVPVRKITDYPSQLLFPGFEATGNGVQQQRNTTPDDRVV